MAVEQVLYYLVRIEPYSTLAIQLQGGKFDHADRMFSDIGSTWHGILEDMSDVKELVSNSFESNVFCFLITEMVPICFWAVIQVILLGLDLGLRSSFDTFQI